MNITIQAKSSSGGFYEVQFVSDENAIRVFCHCPAGEHQMVCKHKVALIKGKSDALSGPDQLKAFNEIRAHPNFVKLTQNLEIYEVRLADIERRKSSAMAEEKQLKAEFSEILRNGFIAR